MPLRRYLWPALALALGIAVVIRLTTAGENPEEIRRQLSQNLRQKNYRTSLNLIAQNMDVFFDEQAQEAEANLRKLNNERFPLTPLPQLLPDFMKRRAFYAETAQSLQQQTPRQTIAAVLNFVTREVASVAGPAEKAEIGVLPEVVLYRGYGVCDRSAWLFCTLLQNARIPAYVVYLIDPETGSSPHTVAAAELDGTLYLFDTYAGTPVYAADGSWATFKNAADGMAKIDEFTLGGQHQLVTHALLQNAIVFLPFEPETLDPVSSILQSALDAESPALFFNYRRRLLHLGSLLFTGQVQDRGTRLVSTEKTYKAALWDYPFRVAHNSLTPAYREEFRTAHAWLPHCYKARGKHLRGSHDEERQMLAEVAESSGTDEDLKKTAEYFIINCKLAAASPDALETATDYLARYPNSIWKSQLQLRVGEYLMQQGNFPLAIEHLQKVEGPRKLRAALLTEAAKRGELPEIFSYKKKEAQPQKPSVTRQVAD